ncbi:MAG: hypothetical protein ABI323_00920 [Solirubrobacteraceae bacterium]
MILTAILNAILAVSVIVMVLTPLVWAILTQQRDHSRQPAMDGATMRAPQSRERWRARRPQHNAVAGRV